MHENGVDLSDKNERQLIQDFSLDKGVPIHLLLSVLLALAPPPALREPLEDDDPSESEDELLMLSLSWPRPHDVVAQFPLSGRRLSVGELSEVVSGALLSILAIPVKASSHDPLPVTGLDTLECLCLDYLRYVLKTSSSGSVYS